EEIFPWAGPYVPTPDDIARANAAFQRRMTPAELEEHIRQAKVRREVANETARTLLAEQPELRRLAAEQFPTVERGLQLLAIGLPEHEMMLRWLRTQHPDLGLRTPLQLMREGHAEVVEQMLYNALIGIPS